MDGALPDSFASDMLDRDDYRTLGGILLALAPRVLFEIGTHRGGTSEFILEALPGSNLVSIASPDDRYNNPLPEEEIGALVTHAGRFTQLIGDSHLLDADAFLNEYGPADLVFIDGDHSFAGVAADACLARSILASGGLVVWHDAHCGKYPDVERYLSLAPFTVVREGSLAAWGPALAGATA